MEWQQSDTADAVIARPAGKVDESNWEQFSEHLTGAVSAALGAAKPLVIDLAQLDYMSSRGLRALTLARKAADGRIEIVLAAPTQRMREILAISRYDQLFRLTDSVAG
jgi:anti-sigma B factor antagonist